MLAFFLVSTGKSQQPAFTGFLNDPWVNARMEQMTLEEKIAQLVMIEVYPEQSESQREGIIKILQRYKPGGYFDYERNTLQNCQMD